MKEFDKVDLTDCKEMPKRKNQILLIRNILANAGDEAMLSREIKEIREAFPTYDLKVLTDNPRRIAQLYQVETDFSDTVLTTPFTKEAHRLVHKNFLRNENSLLNRLNKNISGLTTGLVLPVLCRGFIRSLDEKNRIRLPRHQQKLLENLKSARLVIGGGGLIPSIKGIFLPKITLYHSLSILQVPYILHGQTILPDQRVEQIYRKAAKVLLRDKDLSKSAALKFGVDGEKLVEKLDPAFDLGLVSLEKFLDLETLEFLQKPFLAVNLREWKNKDFSASFSNLAEAINQFQNLFPQTRIVFFPMQNYGTDRDLTAINQLRSQLEPQTESLILSTDISPAALKSVLARALAVITSRYHGAVFGLSAAVPTIGISVSTEYDVKLNGIFSMFAANDFLISAEELTTEHIFSRLKRISENRSGIISELQKEKERLQGLPGLKEILIKVLRDETDNTQN